MTAVTVTVTSNFCPTSRRRRRREEKTARSAETADVLPTLDHRGDVASVGSLTIVVDPEVTYDFFQERAKPIRIKKSEARRVVPDAPKPKNALTETPAPPPPANPFVQSEQQAPQTFGGVIKESFLWGLGVAAAFSVIGIVFSSMEETTSPGKFEGSIVVPRKDQH
ncbi:hypothetical protein PInf_002908 [Phytophthora infestans]|nr:hypothetical protein PInf_002908 [Phytophthora infestans]